MVGTVPRSLADWMWPFVRCFTGATWDHVLVLVAGALLSPGRRTVSAALRVMDLDQSASFAVYHRVLSTARWSARRVAHRLLGLLVAAFVRDGPVVIGLDDTIERRWGTKIKARGIYRDPVRSSHGHFVKASGLRWLCVMLLAPIPWAGCVWALPFLTILAPSERYAQKRGRRHKKLTDWGRQALLQTARWLPDRRIVAVADSSFSVIELLRSVSPYLDVVTRLRLDAGLYEPPPLPRPGARGRPRVKGARLPTLTERVADPATAWQRVVIQGWYGRTQHRLDVATGTALWHHPGRRVLIRWVLVRDAEGSREPSCAPTSMPNPQRSWAGSSGAGGSRSPWPRFAATSVSRLSGSGPISRSCAPPRPCSACSRWSLSGPTGSRVNRAYRWIASAGIPKPIQPSATPSPSFASNFGPHRLSQRHRITGTVQKIPTGSSTA